MDLDDLFKGHKHKSHHHGDPHSHGNEYGHHSHGGHGHDLAGHLSRVQQVLGNKKLLLIIGVGLVVLLLLAAGAVILLLPTIGKLLGLVEAKGIQGLLDSLLQIADKLWRGAGV